ncbi:MAG: AAA-like domain-containing protein, partial [bacterium]
MTPPASQSSAFFVSGGTLKPTAPSYVERAADQEFFDRLLAGDFCYVLTSRQMGKSSLMARTAVKLRAAGALTAIIDLTGIGEGGQGSQSAATWYYGIARAVARELGLKADLKNWWQARDGLPEQQRFAEFLEDFALGATTQRIVIFVDEIDATLRLPFTDDFFAGIRACYNARASKPAFERLTFALLGVASPDELIKDTSRTPRSGSKRLTAFI